MKALYLVTREDLSPGSRAVQAAHAMREFADHFPLLEKDWHETSNTLVLLAVADEAALLALAARCFDRGLFHVVFREPDLADAATAIAIEPEGKSLCRNLKMIS